MRIQHNIMAMSAYRNYTNNVSAMKKNLEKLSSGYKINRAGDDAAGLAISEKMRAQISGLEAAQKNAKDGISLVQTAEGALTEVHDMLNRMVTLATQSANGTYDNDTDRAQLQKEVDQLRSEINRIADSSNFNGIKLLDGSLDGGSGEVSLVSGGTDYASNLTVVYDGQLSDKEPAKGKYYIDFEGATINNNSATGTIAFSITLDGVTGTVSVAANGELTGEDLAKAVKDALDANGTAGDNKMAGTAGGTYSLSVVGNKLFIEMDEVPKSQVLPTMTAAVTGTFNSANLSGNAAEMFKVVTDVEPVAKSSRVYAQAEFTLSAAMAGDGQGIQIGNETYVFASKKSTLEKYQGSNVIDMTDIQETHANYAQIAAERLSKAAEGNKVFKVGANPGDAKISLTEREGGIDYEINNLAGADGISNRNGATTAIDSTANNNLAWKDLVKTGIAGTAQGKGKALMLQIGDTAESFNQLKVNVGDMHCSSLGIDSISIADQDGAASAIDKIKAAINQVSDVRGTLGATQNRLDHTINNLSVMTENIQDAESTIRDTDVAAEMMEYTKNNILIQSAQAMLAQANQVPQGVLQLLQ